MHKIISSTIMDQLTSVPEHALNLDVEPETCLRRLFVCNNGSNGTILGKWSLFERPLCAMVLDPRCRRSCDYIPKFAVL